MRKEYFTDDPNPVKHKRHGNSDWDLVTLHGWNGELKAFKCSHCGEISQADYARCPVCGMVMFHKKAGVRSAQERRQHMGRGKHTGRPQATKPANWDEVMEQWKAGDITAVKAMELTGTKRTTFYKLVKQVRKNDRQLEEDEK